jgi:hypothetical protein
MTADSATATWQRTEAEGFTGRLTGHEAGETTLTFTPYHGAIGGGHEEEGGTFVVPVAVAAPQQ